MVIGIALGLAACGDDTDTPRRRTGSQPLPSELPLLPPAPGGGTEATGPDFAGASFQLLGPALPAGATVVRLRARLTGRGGESIEVESAHRGENRSAVAVTAGTYTVTFLDDNGNPTNFQQTVTIGTDEAEVLAVGSVWISPGSAVQSDRVGTGALQYRLADAAGNTLRTVPGALNTVIDVPATQALRWFGLGVDGELPPVTFEPETGLVEAEFGSIQVRRRAIDAVQIRGANGVTLFPETSDLVEYLVPAAPQADGCMVYQGVVNQLTTQTITLCTDAVDHALLDAR